MASVGYLWHRQRRPAPKEDLPAFETARVDELTVSSPLISKALRQGLATRYNSLRRMLLIISTACIACHLLIVGIRLRSGDDGELTRLHWIRVLSVALVFSLLLIALAASFPTDAGLASPSGQRLSKPIAIINAANAAIYVALSTRTCLKRQASTDVPVREAFVHLAFGVTFVLNWCVHGYRLWVGRRTHPWGITRIALFLDGLLFIIAAMTLHCLNTTLGYPPLAVPGNTFTGAIFRGATTVALGLLFTPRVRRWISEGAHRKGLNHVRLALDQGIHVARSDDEHSSHESTESSRSASQHSHHTSKVVGLMCY